MIKYGLLINLLLLSASSIYGMDGKIVQKSDFTDKEKAFAAIGISQLYRLGLTDKIYENKKFKEVPVNVVMGMDPRKQLLVLKVVDQLKNDKNIVVTREEYNKIVGIPQDVKDCIEEGTCIVPADRWTKTKRIMTNWFTNSVSSVVLATVAGGLIRPYFNYEKAREAFQELKKATYESVFKYTVTNEYPAVLRDAADYIITENGCLHDQLIDFTTNSVVDEDPGKIAHEFGKEVRNNVVNGNYSLMLPWKSFHDASKTTCFDIHSSEIKTMTQKIVTDRAVGAATQALENLIPPVQETFAPDRDDALIGGLLGMGYSFITTALKGGFSHPIKETAINNMNQKI